MPENIKTKYGSPGSCQNVFCVTIPQHAGQLAPMLLYCGHMDCFTLSFSGVEGKILLFHMVLVLIYTLLCIQISLVSFAVQEHINIFQTVLLNFVGMLLYSNMFSVASTVLLFEYISNMFVNFTFWIWLHLEYPLNLLYRNWYLYVLLFWVIRRM